MSASLVAAARVACVASMAAAALAGCEKTTTTTKTADGTVTTTTVSASAQASQALARADAIGARVAADVRTLDRKVGDALGSASASAGSTLKEGAERLDAKAGAAVAKADDAIDDGVVTTKVKSALLVDPDVKALSIKVETHAGVVTLSGSADSAAQVTRAVRIAHDTTGVKSVRSQLVVKPAG